MKFEDFLLFVISCWYFVVVVDFLRRILNDVLTLDLVNMLLIFFVVVVVMKVNLVMLLWGILWYLLIFVCCSCFFWLTLLFWGRFRYIVDFSYCYDANFYHCCFWYAVLVVVVVVKCLIFPDVVRTNLTSFVVVVVKLWGLFHCLVFTSCCSLCCICDFSSKFCYYDGLFETVLISVSFHYSEANFSMVCLDIFWF